MGRSKSSLGQRVKQGLVALAVVAVLVRVGAGLVGYLELTQGAELVGEERGMAVLPVYAVDDRVFEGDAKTGRLGSASGDSVLVVRWSDQPAGGEGDALYEALVEGLRAEGGSVVGEGELAELRGHAAMRSAVTLPERRRGSALIWVCEESGRRFILLSTEAYQHAAEEVLHEAEELLRCHDQGQPG